MGRKSAETAMGAVVVLISIGFVYFFITTVNVGTVQGYEVKAIFTKVGGLQPGSDVRISGINVGTVKQRTLDPKTYGAIVTLSINSGVNLPEDTVATIGNEGLFGGKYVQLKPGNSIKSLTAGANIDAEDYRSLEDQVGEIIFLATGSDRDGGGSK